MLRRLVEKIEEYRDLIVISIKSHHKKSRLRQRSKRPLEIAASLLGVGSMAPISCRRPCQFVQKLQQMIIFLYYITVGKV
jgi:hypothetical protein